VGQVTLYFPTIDYIRATLETGYTDVFVPSNVPYMGHQYLYKYQYPLNFLIISPLHSILLSIFALTKKSV